MIHEIFIHREMPVIAGVRSKETVEYVAAYLTLSNELGKEAREREVGCLVLSHFVPPSCGRDALLAEVARDFDGPLISGEDLMALDLESCRLCYGNFTMAIGR